MTPSESEALGLAAQLGYEVAEWGGRWHWRHVKWNPGVWWAADYASPLDALEAIARRGRQEERR